MQHSFISPVGSNNRIHAAQKSLYECKNKQGGVVC